MNVPPRATARRPSDSRWSATDRSRWLVGPPVSQSPRMRMLCIPHAGGGPSAFRPWSPLLPPDVQMLVAQLPGRESRYAEAPLEQLGPVVDGIATTLASLSELPLILFGHSMGALIAYELARTLSRGGGRAPVLLVVSGHGSPQNPDNYSGLLDTDADTFAEQVAIRYGGIPAPIRADKALLQFFIPLLRADFKLVASHRAMGREPLDCMLLALGGDGDPHVSHAMLAEWRMCTRNRFEVRVFHGGHFYLAEQVGAVLTTLFGMLELEQSV